MRLISESKIEGCFLTNLTAKLVVNLFIKILVILATTVSPVYAQIKFDLANTKETPFPSDLFTVSDDNQITERRVSLPMPDCTVYVTDCRIVKYLNKLDGFNVQARLSIPFSSTIDVNTINSETVFLVRMDDDVEGKSNCQFIENNWNCENIVGVNQVVWDSETHTLYAESDKLLQQHTTYALIVTNKVKYLKGEKLTPNTFNDFQSTLKKISKYKSYQEAIKKAMEISLKLTGLSKNNIISVSVFTTQSVTAMMEKMRSQIQELESLSTNFNLGTNGERTVFSMNSISNIVQSKQMKADINLSGAFESYDYDLESLRFSGINSTILSKVAYGKFKAADYRDIDFDKNYITIPDVPSKNGSPIIQRFNDLYFTLLLPAGVKPENGWPVAIYGTGSGSDKDYDTFSTSEIMLKKGIAVIAINAATTGDGPLSTLKINLIDGSKVRLPSGGRTIDINGNGLYEEDDILDNSSFAMLSARDMMRQTVVDLMQLTKQIKNGIDVDNDGISDLDGSRINYLGSSLGGIIGTIFLAIESDIQAGVINAGAGSIISSGRLSFANRDILDSQVENTIPLLRNTTASQSRACMQMGYFTICESIFDENMPLRDKPVLINDIAGAIKIQDFIEKLEWLHQNGSPESFAPYIRQQPLANNQPKNVIFQIAHGDPVMDNISSAAVLRAGNLAEYATMYRHDLVYSDPYYQLNSLGLFISPHEFLDFRLYKGTPIELIGIQTHQQIATFFSTDGQSIIDPDGQSGKIFEMLTPTTIPDNCSYIALEINFKPCQ